MYLGVYSIVPVVVLTIVVRTESKTYQDDGAQSTQGSWIDSTSTSIPPKSQVSEESGGVSRNDDRAVRPIDKGLQPLYVMVKEFLDLVQPDSKADWIDDPRFDHG